MFGMIGVVKRLLISLFVYNIKCLNLCVLMTYMSMYIHKYQMFEFMCVDDLYVYVLDANTHNYENLILYSRYG